MALGAAEAEGAAEGLAVVCVDGASGAAECDGTAASVLGWVVAEGGGGGGGATSSDELVPAESLT